MNVVIETGRNLQNTIGLDMGSYRYRVFFQKLGWQLHCEAGLEYDEFDRDDTVYLVAMDEDDGAVIGTARLLPTVRPYLLEKVFPQLLGEQPIPRSPYVWELSRFAAVDFKSAASAGPRQFSSSPVAVGLLREALKCAAALGAQRLISVSPLGVERLLQRSGFRAWRAAPPVLVDGSPLFACWIECD